MSPSRGRPAKQIPKQAQDLERAIARRLRLDPDDPATAESLVRNRLPRADRRPIKKAAVEDWAWDAYRYYAELLRDGLDLPGVARSIPHVEIPATSQRSPSFVVRGDEEEAAYFAATLELILWRDGPDLKLSRSAEAIQKAVKRSAPIWQIAERNFP